MKTYRGVSTVNSRRFGMFFLFMLAIGVIVVSFNLVQRIGRTDIYHSVDPHPYFAANATLTQHEMASPELNLKIDLQGIQQSEPIIQEVCINDVELNFFVNRTGDPIGFHDGESHDDVLVCVNRDGKTQSNLSSPLTATLPINLQEFPSYYPYDSVELTVIASYYGYWGENNQNAINNVEIPVENSWDILIPDRELHQRILSTPNHLGTFQFEIKAARPFIYRVLTPILVFVIFFFIALTPLIRDVSAYAQSVLALFFGIWTVRQLLFPYELRGTNLLDALFISFYVCLAFSAIFWLYLNYGNIVGASIETYQPEVLIAEKGSQEETKILPRHEGQSLLSTSTDPLNINAQRGSYVGKKIKLPKSPLKNRRKRK